MKNVDVLFKGIHSLIGLFFVLSAFVLVVFAGIELWEGVNIAQGIPLSERFNLILDAIAVLTIAVAALELGQTVIEEEVVRESHLSTPTRVRRFLSRFLIVIVVALSIESLVAAFRYSHDTPENLPFAASIAAAAALLLTAWGVFVHLNRKAEELEPEAIQSVMEKDAKVG